jgi:hypothetical protein
MNDLRQLIVDADIEIIHDSGSRIGIRLEAGAGEGVIELSDKKLLLLLIKQMRANHGQGVALYQQLIPRLEGRVDFFVQGWRVACLDSTQKADFICRHLGLTGCRIRPFTLLLSLIRP